MVHAGDRHVLLGRQELAVLGLESRDRASVDGRRRRARGWNAVHRVRLVHTVNPIDAAAIDHRVGDAVAARVARHVGRGERAGVGCGIGLEHEGEHAAVGREGVGDRGIKAAPVSGKASGAPASAPPPVPLEPEPLPPPDPLAPPDPELLPLEPELLALSLLASAPEPLMPPQAIQPKAPEARTRMAIATMRGSPCHFPGTGESHMPRDGARAATGRWVLPPRYWSVSNDADAQRLVTARLASA